MSAAVDFSTYYVKSLTDVQVAALASAAHTVILGFDSSPASQAVLQSILGANLSWWAYRFLYWAQDVAQVQDCITAVHRYTPTVAQLPASMAFDCEENTGGPAAPANPSNYLHRLMDYVEAQDITPHSAVKPAIYTRKDYWEQYFQGYTEPADRGWGLWTAEPGRGSTPDTALLYGGWQRNQVIAVQTAENVDMAGLSVDTDLLRDGVVTASAAQQTLAQIEALVSILRGQIA